MKWVMRWGLKALGWACAQLGRVSPELMHDLDRARAMMPHQAHPFSFLLPDYDLYRLGVYIATTAGLKKKAERYLRYLSSELAVERQRSPFSPRVRKRTEELKELTASVRAM